MNKQLENLKIELDKAIKGLGYYLVEVEFAKGNLNITIDNDNGVMIEDCEKVHRFIDPIVDNFDISKGQAFVMNVSSYGLDRALKNDYDYNKFVNKIVHFKFFAPYKGQKEFDCELIGFDNSSIKVKYNNELISIEKTKIAKISQIIDF